MVGLNELIIPEYECDLCKLVDEEIEKKNYEYLKKLKKTLESI